MTDLTPNHPAVEAAARAAHERAWCGESEPWSEVDDLERDEWRADEAHALNAALLHLTADDLRNTPAGRKLMAEAWKVCAEFILSPPTGSPTERWVKFANPYRQADA